ncbi:MAG: hypothetical protein HY075_00100 [Deltaproteobacteria bacterium]|nr:hypothetical protein [Deltaproteobacteria bacterium]
MRAYLISLIALLTGVFALNSLVDVSGLGTFDEIYGLALGQGPRDVLVWEESFDQRAWVKAMVEKSASCDVLILGSSTVGGFSSEMFPGRRVLNGWLSNATVEDFEAIAYLLESHPSCRPKTVVFGVDHWLLNPKFNERRWLSLDHEVQRYGGKSRVQLAATSFVKAWEQLKERLNFTTTRATILFLASHSGPHERPRLVHDALPAYCREQKTSPVLRFADGHFSYCPQFEPTHVDARTAAVNYVPQDSHGIRGWERVDPERVARLSAVSRRLEALGAKIVYVAPPFHPVTYRDLGRSTSIHRSFDALDALLGKLSAENGATYVNLRNPVAAGCADDEFRDSHHSAPACMAKVANSLLR